MPAAGRVCANARISTEFDVGLPDSGLTANGVDGQSLVRILILHDHSGDPVWAQTGWAPNGRLNSAEAW
jgi:hypothetical protein